jgi:ATP-dependent Lon protease
MFLLMRWEKRFGSTMKPLKIKNTSEVHVPDRLIDQIIGQDRAVKIIKNAAKQRRNILLIGTPGTGKSMLAQGMAELMPAEELEDVLMYPNRNDENNPVVRVVKTQVPKELAKKMNAEKGGAEKGQGRLIVEQERMKGRLENRGGISPVLIVVAIAMVAILYLSFSGSGDLGGDNKYLVPAIIIGGAIVLSALIFSSQLSRRMGGPSDNVEPKLIIDNTNKKAAPFVDATGSKAGALFGDVKHDPLQSFMPEEKFYVCEGNKHIPTSFASLWKKMGAKYPERIERKDGYEFIAFPKEEEVYVLSMNSGETKATRVMSMNRRTYAGRSVIIHTEEGKLSTTPEHKYVLHKGEKEAQSLQEGDEILSV